MNPNCPWSFLPYGWRTTSLAAYAHKKAKQQDLQQQKRQAQYEQAQADLDDFDRIEEDEPLIISPWDSSPPQTDQQIDKMIALIPDAYLNAETSVSETTDVVPKANLQITHPNSLTEVTHLRERIPIILPWQIGSLSLFTYPISNISEINWTNFKVVVFWMRYKARYTTDHASKDSISWDYTSHRLNNWWQVYRCPRRLWRCHCFIISLLWP